MSFCAARQDHLPDKAGLRIRGWLVDRKLVTARLAPVTKGDDCANRAATDVNAAGCVQTSRLRLTVIHKWPQQLSLVGAFIAVIDATTRRRLAV